MDDKDQLCRKLPFFTIPDYVSIAETAMGTLIVGDLEYRASQLEGIDNRHTKAEWNSNRSR